MMLRADVAWKPPEGYGRLMWDLLQNAAIITKDRRFAEYGFKPSITARWCDQYGC